MLFFIKMKNFRQQTRLFTVNQMDEAPATITFASIVSRETIRIALMIAALNYLNVMLGDIFNTYVQYLL